MILDGFENQDRPSFCPECGYYLKLQDVVGVGDYPQGGHRSHLKPGSGAIGFLCPKCFTKSCHHAALDYMETIERYLEENK